jgi:hypothetical protein
VSPEGITRLKKTPASNDARTSFDVGTRETEAGQALADVDEVGSANRPHQRRVGAVRIICG